MTNEFVHTPVLTKLQSSGQESSTESLFILVTLGALALILFSVVTLYTGYMLLIEDVKVLFHIGLINVTLSLVGMVVIAFSALPLTYAYKLLRKIVQL